MNEKDNRSSARPPGDGPSFPDAAPDTRAATFSPRPLSGASIGPVVSVVILAAVLVVLALTDLHSFLLFHSLVEVFFVVIVSAVLGVAWNLRGFLDDDFPLFLAVALFAVGVLRLVHMLDYEGSRVLGTVSPDHENQLWLAAMLLLSLSFLVAPWFIGRRFSAAGLAGVYGGIVAIVLASVYWWDVFPEAYRAATGYTTFRNLAEVAICLVFVGAIVTLWRRRRLLTDDAVVYLVSSYVLCIVAEVLLAFTTSAAHPPQLIAHLLTVAAAYLIYKAVAEASLARPHALAVANLELREAAERSRREQEERLRADFDELLQLTPTFHIEAGYGHTTQAVCRAAQRMFKCRSATLFLVRDEPESDEGARRIMLEVLAREPQAELMRRGTSFDITDDAELLRRVVTNRDSSFLRDAGQHPLLPAGVDRRLQRRAESALRVPLGVGPRADRVLTIVWGETRPAPDRLLEALVRRFADQAEVALSQAARLEEQARVTKLHREMLSGLLPDMTVDGGAVTVTSVFRSGERRLEMGGDFADVLELGGGQVAAVIGDVSGHGPQAAALGANLRAAWEALVRAGADVPTTMAALARILERERQREGRADAFVTMCLAWLDTAACEVRVLNIGHPQPLLLGDDVELIAVGPHPPLGVADGMPWEPHTVALPKRWALLFYTDGLVEARRGKAAPARLGTNGLIGLLMADCPPQWDGDAVARVVARAEELNGERFADDVAVVLIAPAAAPAVA